MAKHPIVHIEFSAKDRGKAVKFYSQVFGWSTQEQPEYNYATFNPGEGPEGGFNPVTDAAPAGTVLVYIGTDDIERDLKNIEKQGGKTVVPKTVIPNIGWFGIFEDPSGNHVGLYTAMQPG
jgi:predicted enzyme related to lactoylglutathione lyase